MSQVKTKRTNPAKLFCKTKAFHFLILAINARSRRIQVLFIVVRHQIARRNRAAGHGIEA